tara:strand:- start:1652 stop:1945 length:294 start_codon:yes stop_codon:yes gene_type:complete
MATLRVLNPVAGKRTDNGSRPARRVDGFEGKVIGLYDNRKPSGGVVLERLTGHLTSRFQGIEVRQYAGSLGARAVATVEDAERMASECDAVIGIRAD